MKSRKRVRSWENIGIKILQNKYSENLLKTKRDVYIQRRIQQQKLCAMKQIILFLMRRFEQLKYITEYNIYKYSYKSELNELEARLLKQKDAELNELREDLLKESKDKFNDDKINELESRLLKQKEAELNELEARLLKENQSKIQKYHTDLKQQKDKMDEYRWALLQQIETEFTTGKESEIKKSYEEEFDEYKRLIGEKMVQLQIENMELKEENTKLKNKKWSLFNNFFSKQ
jgi:hypothetical protein